MLFYLSEKEGLSPSVYASFDFWVYKEEKLLNDFAKFCPFWVVKFDIKCLHFFLPRSL